MSRIGRAGLLVGAPLRVSTNRRWSETIPLDIPAGHLRGTKAGILVCERAPVRDCRRRGSL